VLPNYTLFPILTYLPEYLKKCQSTVYLYSVLLKFHTSERGGAHNVGTSAKDWNIHARYPHPYIALSVKKHLALLNQDNTSLRPLL